MSWEAACIFSTGEAMIEPQLISANLLQEHFVLSKILPPVGKGIAMELIRAEQVSKWECF